MLERDELLSAVSELSDALLAEGVLDRARTRLRELRLRRRGGRPLSLIVTQAAGMRKSGLRWRAVFSRLGVSGWLGQLRLREVVRRRLGRELRRPQPQSVGQSPE